MANFDEDSKYFFINGVAKDRGMKALCQNQLIFCTSNRERISEILENLSKNMDCFEVKLSKQDKKGVYSGVAIFTNENSLGDAWSKYESDPDLWVSTLDEHFSKRFRKKY